VISFFWDGPIKDEMKKKVSQTCMCVCVCVDLCKVVCEGECVCFLLFVFMWICLHVFKKIYIIHKYVINHLFSTHVFI
jgi:hypothetical protein